MTTPPTDLDALSGLLLDSTARFELLRIQDEAITGKDISDVKNSDGDIDLAKRIVNLKSASQWAVEYGNRLIAELTQARSDLAVKERILKDVVHAFRNEVTKGSITAAQDNALKAARATLEDRG